MRVWTEKLKPNSGLKSHVRQVSGATAINIQHFQLQLDRRNVSPSVETILLNNIQQRSDPPIGPFVILVHGRARKIRQKFRDRRGDWN